jgi:hypothetical protein
MGQRPELKETAREWRRLLYSKIENIFEYENLPEEVNETALKLFLFKTGKIIFYKIKDKFLIQPFAYTDRLDWYYVPANGRVVNPWLPAGFQNKEFKLADEAIIYNSTPDIYNIRQYSVVSDLIFKTAYQLAENDISYYCIQRNHRLIAIFTAENDLQKAECNRILERIYEGYPDVTMAEDLVSHIKVNPIAMNSTRSSITELIEFQQYIIANFYHSFGINSNYNLKREQLNSNEIDVNEEVLRLNIEDMLVLRQQGVEKVNDLYGLNIMVHLNEKVYKKLLQEAGNVSEDMDGRLIRSGYEGEVKENISEVSESIKGNELLRPEGGNGENESDGKAELSHGGTENKEDTSDEVSGDTSENSIGENGSNYTNETQNENGNKSEEIRVEAENVNIIITEQSKIETISNTEEKSEEKPEEKSEEKSEDKSEENSEDKPEGEVNDDDNDK